LEGKSEENRQLGRPRWRRNYINKINLKKYGGGLVTDR
jgi:hypothetical protein